MIAIDYVGVATLIGAIGSVFTSALAIWLARPIRDTHNRVKTSNGQTIGEAVEAIGKATGADHEQPSSSTG